MSLFNLLSVVPLHLEEVSELIIHFVSTVYTSNLVPITPYAKLSLISDRMTHNVSFMKGKKEYDEAFEILFLQFIAYVS